jgi:hypothetical protein
MDATQDDDTCAVDDALGVCGGDCASDEDNNGTCDAAEVLGCMDDTACNYDMDATQDDDTCAVNDACGVCGGDDSTCSGCTEAVASNFDADATIDDGSCCYLVISLFGTDAVCFGGEGMIAATVTGAVATVTYTLGMDSNETGIFAVNAGIYTVSAMDSNANMCTSTMAVAVGEVAEIIVTASATDETAGALGVGTATATGGSGEYTFIWYDSNGNVVDVSALAAGDYTVRAADSNGCVGGVNITINFNGIDDIDPLAFGLFPNPTTGGITLLVSTEMHDVNMQVFDASGKVVFTQSNFTIQGSVNLDLSNLSTGTYSMMLSNNNGVSVRRLSILH